MQQGALSLGLDGTVLYSNRSFAEMVRRPLEKVIGADVAGFLHPPDRPAFREMLGRAQGPGSRGELRLQGPDASTTPAYLAIAPLPLGESAALCLVVTDLTEQARHRELLQVNRRKDEFLATLAHELRNPLAPIRNALYLMKQEGDLATPGEEVRSMMERQVEHLARLIDDLMDVSRISTGRVELRMEEVDLASVVARAVEVSRGLMEQRGHHFTAEFPTLPIRLRADPTRLEQVVDNLLTNAAKYTDTGGRIELVARLEGETAVLSLRDTGIGIDPAKLPTIFDLFVQAERRLERSQGGLGIGLSLVKSLVEMHGGRVTVASEGLGRGTEFVVRLPALVETRPGGLLLDPPATPEPTLPSRRVLVVDDNVDSARSMALLLQRIWGQVVQVAHDGEEAIRAAAEFAPEIVLLDIGLPGLSGYDVAARLKADPETAGAILVAMTGWGNEDDLRRSRDSGFAHHLIKPIDLDALRDLIAG